jgi:hypothetical protein
MTRMAINWGRPVGWLPVVLIGAAALFRHVPFPYLTTAAGARLLRFSLMTDPTHMTRERRSRRLRIQLSEVKKAAAKV